MANKRIGGIIQFKINGEIFSAKGEFSYNLGIPKKEMVAGSDGIHGFKEMPQVPYIEGAITDNDELDLAALQAVRDATITLELANGKVITLDNAIYAADGKVSSSEGEIEARFEGTDGRETA